MVLYKLNTKLCCHEVIVQVEKLLNMLNITLVTAKGYLLLFLAFIGSGFVAANRGSRDENELLRHAIDHRNFARAKFHPRRYFPRALRQQEVFQMLPNALADLHRQLEAHERSTRSLQSFGKRWSDVDNTVRPATVSTMTGVMLLGTDGKDSGKNKSTSHEPATNMNLEHDSVLTHPAANRQQPPTSIPAGSASSSTEKAQLETSSLRSDIKAFENLDYAQTDSHVEGVTHETSSMPVRDMIRNESDPVLVMFLSLLRQIDPKHNISVAAAKRILSEARRGQTRRLASHLGLDRHNHHVKRGAPQRKKHTSLYELLNAFPTTATPSQNQGRMQQSHLQPLPPQSPIFSLPDGSAGVLPPTSVKGGHLRENIHTIYHNSGLTLRMLPDGRVEFVEDTVIDAYCVVNILRLGLNLRVKIRGKKTGRYLAMRNDGSLYGAENDNDNNTNFRHVYKASSHDAYMSIDHESFISLRNGKPTRRRFRNDTNKRTHFLVREARSGLLLTESPIDEVSSNALPTEALPPSTTSAEVSSPSQTTTTAHVNVSTTKDMTALATTSTSTSQTKPTASKPRSKGSKPKKGKKKKRKCRKRRRDRKRCKTKKCRKQNRRKCRSKKKKKSKRKQKKTRDKAGRRVSRSIHQALESEDIFKSQQPDNVLSSTRLEHQWRRLKRPKLLLRLLRRRLRNSSALQAVDNT
uniref:Fibroblast growth factor with large molecular mass n=1 Tax=Phallusia mammillata TaxID=59560 RepID=A0A6F9DDK0_9ASCI|nr:fibroblast growth factor with large molecular mass [Phallusia mammillata]